MIAIAYASNVWVSFGIDPDWRVIGLIAAFAICVCLVCLFIRRR